MTISEFFTLIVYGLIGWGIVFTLLRLTGMIHWHAMWVMSPVFAAVVIWVIMVIIAAALGGKF